MPQSTGRLQSVSSAKILPGGKILHGIIRFFVPVAFLLFGAGCNKPKIDAGSLSWEGASVNPVRELLNPSVSQLQEEGFSPVLEPLPAHLLELREGSGIKLLQFNSDIEAYAAFQKFSNADELEDGFVLKGDKTLFRKGIWLGLCKLHDGNIVELVKTNLGLPGDEDWGALPKIYSSFLQQGRVSRSERVLLNRFMGIVTPKPVFSAQFDCHGDSARVYVSPEMPQRFSVEIGNMTGYRIDSSAENINVISDSSWTWPARIEFSRFGMVGVEGCFDTSLTDYWIKTQEIALKSFK